MPPKKKKGKGSKLSRMSDEEKLRYLQHRAEIELESKRRKQQLIASFTKNKLKREEIFARINIAKINEQWRYELRQLKCKELYDNLDYLWKYFDIALKSKNDLIDKLYDKLNICDNDNRKLQSLHINMIDKFINNHRLRLNKLHDYYIKSIIEIKTNELNELNNDKCLLYNDNKQIQIVNYALSNIIDDKLMTTKIRNATNTNTIEYYKIDDKMSIDSVIGNKINNFRAILNDIIVNYQEMTHDKRKHYDILSENDAIYQSEVINFPILQSKLIHTIELLKYREDIIKLTRNTEIIELLNQIKMSNKQIYKLKYDINMYRTLNEIQLKKQTIISGKIIDYLNNIKQKSIKLTNLMKICLNYERLLLVIDKNYDIYTDNNIKDNNIYCVIEPYDKLENFWKQYSYIKSENIFIKNNYNELIYENNKLRDSLRYYLINISRIPDYSKSSNYNLIKTNK